jgi:ribosomal protein S18 acetylase RimI-like enzyme
VSLPAAAAAAAAAMCQVQTSNAAALSFYTRFGFSVTGSIPNYYKRITPPDCFIVAKSIAH